MAEWREALPSPFDKPPPRLQRRASASEGPKKSAPRKRRDSAPGAADQIDRCVSWLRFNDDAATRREHSKSAVFKLKRYTGGHLLLVLKLEKLTQACVPQSPGFNGRRIQTHRRRRRGRRPALLLRARRNSTGRYIGNPLSRPSRSPPRASSCHWPTSVSRP